MNHTTFTSLVLSTSILAFTLAAGAGEPAASPTPATASATSPMTSKQREEKTSRPMAATIRVNAPIFSPQFSSMPLAEVNDEFITMDDLKKALGAIHEGKTADTSTSKQNIPVLLNRLINTRLIIQEGRNIGFDKQDNIKKAAAVYSTELLRETLLMQQASKVKLDEQGVEKAYAQRSREWRFKSIIFAQPEDVKAFEAGLKSGKSFDELFDAAVKGGQGLEGGKQDEFIHRSAVSPELLAIIDKMKPGEVSSPQPLEKGAVFYRVEEVRVKDDPELRTSIRQELDKAARVKALEEYKQGLIKKNVTLKKKLYDKLTYNVSKAQFDKLLKDKRVVAEIKGDKPITVAELTESLKSKYFHGIERALEGRKVNISKDMVYDEILTARLFMKDARDRRIEESEEYRTRLKAYVDSLVFNEFLTRVVRDEIRVTPDELDAYYKEHAKEFTSAGEIRLAAIAFDALGDAENAVDKLSKGTDYKWYVDNAAGQASIGNEYSGIFTGNPLSMELLPEKLSKALIGVKSGEYRVFQDGKVTYAVAVLEFVNPQTIPYANIEGTIKQRMFYVKLNQGVELWAEKLKASSEITMYADFDKQEKP